MFADVSVSGSPAQGTFDVGAPPGNADPARSTRPAHLGGPGLDMGAAAPPPPPPPTSSAQASPAGPPSPPPATGYPFLDAVGYRLPTVLLGDGKGNHPVALLLYSLLQGSRRGYI